MKGDAANDGAAKGEVTVSARASRQTRFGRTRPGVALLLALAIVVVLTSFLSELFLDTGLEVRAISNFRDSDQAQSLARSAFRALEIALKTQTEELFAAGYFQLTALLQLSPAPFEAGLLTRMQVTSVDGMFNLNEVGSAQPGSGLDILRWALFKTKLLAIQPTSEITGQIADPLTDLQVTALYAALVDWIDADDTEYSALGVRGAEQRAYVGNDPEYEIKNAPLDRVEELRLVRGFMDMHLPWSDVASGFVALPRSQDQAGTYLPEKLDVNLATRNEITSYLSGREVTEAKVLQDTTLGPTQKVVNRLASEAAAIAAAAVPDGQERPFFSDMSKFATAINGGTGKGVTGDFRSQDLDLLFRSCAKYLRVRVSVLVDQTEANLDATIYLDRPNCSALPKITVLSYTVH
jgi:hypothetical protein